MANVLAELVAKITTDTKGLQTGLQDAEKSVGRFGGFVQKHQKAIGAAIVGMGAAALGAAVASVQAFASMGDEVQKMALRTGFGTEALSELRHAAQLSGADITSLEKASRTLSGAIVDAGEGMETYVRALGRLGLSYDDLAKLSPEEQFLEVMGALADVEDETKKAATAADLFGRSGTQLLPMLANGADGLEAMRQEAHKLGIVFDEEAANAAAQLTDDFTRLEGAVNGLKFTMAKELVPSLEAGIPLLTEWAKALGPIIENTLNWHAAHDKHIKQKDAWQNMMLERQKALGGLTNEYEKSVDVLESVLRQNDQWNSQTEETVERLKEEIEARTLHKEVIEETTEALEEQAEEYEKTSKRIDDIIREMKYESSVAGNLGLSVKDVIKAVIKMGVSTEHITEVLTNLGDEQNDVLVVMEALGVSAEEVAQKLDIETESLIKMGREYSETTGKVKKLIEAQKNITGGAGGGRTEEGMSPEQVAYAKGWDWWNLTPSQYDEVVKEAGSPQGYQHGGIVTRPTVGLVGEAGPEAIIPLDEAGWEGFGGARQVNIWVELDGRTIAKAIGQPLVDEIYLRTGIK